MAGPGSIDEPPRERLVAAALPLFASHGFGGASTRDIAAVARARQSLVRYHFGDKQGLWRASVLRAGEQLGAALVGPAGVHGPAGPLAGPAAPRLLRQRLATGLAALAGEPHAARLLLRHAVGEGPDPGGGLSGVEPADALSALLPAGAALSSPERSTLGLFVLGAVAADRGRSDALDPTRAEAREALADMLAELILSSAGAGASGPWSVAAARLRRLRRAADASDTPGEAQ